MPQLVLEANEAVERAGIGVRVVNLLVQINYHHHDGEMNAILVSLKLLKRVETFSGTCVVVDKDGDDDELGGVVVACLGGKFFHFLHSPLSNIRLTYSSNHPNSLFRNNGRATRAFSLHLDKYRGIGCETRHLGIIGNEYIFSERFCCIIITISADLSTNNNAI